MYWKTFVQGMESKNGYEDYKIFNDPIHGHIEIGPLCIAIIDTPEFQRLRHIAGQFASMLGEKQPMLGIDDKDILCVQVAGLCHDLGHGPFSHTWDRFINKKFEPKKWTHEQCSVKLFQYLIKNNHLETKLEKSFGKDYDTYVKYIEQQIAGDENSRNKHPWISFKNGENKNKNFLYEIVANKIAGVDVDKWDYLSRDCYYLGFKPSFDHQYLMRFARICEDKDGSQHICYRDKEWLSVQQMFHTRWMLHRAAYQHRVVKAIEVMLLEALDEADSFLEFIGTNGKRKCLSETTDDIESFLKLSDYIYHKILFSDDEKLRKARQILENIEKRNLYGFVGRVFVNENLANEIKKDYRKFSEEIVGCIGGDGLCLSAEDIILETMNFDYGMKHQNPLERIYFYSKKEPNVAKTQNIYNQSKMVITHFEEKFLICLCRQKKFLQEAEEKFESWCKKKGLKPFHDADIPTDS